jgi:hypothetical protein
LRNGVVFPSRSLIQPRIDEEQLSFTIQARKAVVAVISHDCEFNERKRNKLLVARLQGVQGNLSDEDRQALRDSNDVQARSDASLTGAAVDSFLFAPVPGVFEDEHVVNFATITSLPMKMTDDLFVQKRAELDHETRVLFRFKLGGSWAAPLTTSLTTRRSTRRL